VRRALWALLLALWCASSVQAHNLDTSYARCVVSDDRVETRITFDIFTLMKIADLDTNHDQRLSRSEVLAGAAQIQSFIREHVRIEIDGQAVDLGEAQSPGWPQDVGKEIAAPDWHAAGSLISFPFRKATAHPAKAVALTFTLFTEIGARHTALGVFEHEGKTQEVTFTEAEPDYLYDVTYGEEPRKESVPAALRRFLKLGIEHIFLGYDHICFLLALVVVGRFTDLIKIVTSFTVAHSITLILAALKIVTIPSRFTECGIALTIIYVAAENIFRKNITRRWMLTFFFGLVHGFGFANVLAELGLPPQATIRCLLSFNVGVELGQLTIVLAAFPLLALLTRSRHAVGFKMTLSAAVGLFGLGWFIERAFNLGFMPM